MNYNNRWRYIAPSYNNSYSNNSYSNSYNNNSNNQGYSRDNDCRCNNYAQYYVQPQRAVVRPVISQYTIIPQYISGVDPIYISNVYGFIQRTVSNLSNWVQETFTTSDPNELSKLYTVYNDSQSHVQSSAYSLPNGAVFTLTSNNYNTAYQLQSKTYQFPSWYLVDGLFYSNFMNVNVLNVSNGVQITVTSCDSFTLSNIQTAVRNINAKNTVQVYMSQQYNGITVTLQSSDYNVVSNLQYKMASF